MSHLDYLKPVGVAPPPEPYNHVIRAGKGQPLRAPHCRADCLIQQMSEVHRGAVTTERDRAAGIQPGREAAPIRSFYKA